MEFANSQVKEALAFEFSPMPLNGKIPTVNNWQKIPTEELVKKLEHHNGNIGIRTGKWSNVIIIDCDKPRKYSKDPDGHEIWKEIVASHTRQLNTVVAKSGSGSYHYYFKYDPSLKYVSKITGSNIDVLSDGKQAVYPGSIYPGCGGINHKCGVSKGKECLFKGNKYEWVNSPENTDILEIPKWLIPYITKTDKKVKEPVNESDDTPSSDTDILEAILDNLSPHRWDCGYDEWRLLVWLMVKYQIPRITIHNYAKQSPVKYNETELDILIDSYDAGRCTSTIGPNSWIINWLREDLMLQFENDGVVNPEDQVEVSINQLLNRYNNIYSDVSVESFSGDSELGELFYKVYGKENIKTVSVNGLAYEWIEDKKLWIKQEPIFIRTKIYNILKPIILQHLNKHDKESDEYKIINNALYRIKKSLNRRGLHEALICLTFDGNFENIINKNHEYLPIKNNRVINLKTLEIRERTRDDYFTVELNIDYLTSPILHAETYFKSLMNNNEELYNYLQRILGYCITGETMEKSLFIFYGFGDNGKSALINILHAILGPFFTTLSDKVILKRDTSNSTTPELVSLHHTRLGVLNESNEDSVLNAERVKALSGCDTIQCNPKYKDEFMFKPYCKIILCTNNRPAFNSTDIAMINRLKLIPFDAKFEVNRSNNNYIEDIKNKYLDEIFTWIANGSALYYTEEKIITAPIIDRYMTEYVNENDVVGRFLDECCVLDPESSVQKTIFYKYFNALDLSSRKIGIREFHKILLKKGILEGREHNIRVYKGVKYIGIGK